MQTAQTAEQAFDLYRDYLARDALVQSSWHAELDGRQLACGLGVLGPDINSPGDCPATVMPRWLAQMVPWFFDNQNFDDAKSWGMRFYGELARLNGDVPFVVVHDWHAHFVTPLGLKWRKIRGLSPDAVQIGRAHV